VSLQAGETRRVTFPITRETLGCWDRTMTFRVTPGSYRLFVGTSSAAGECVTLTVE
jgi:hypothetical protein